MQQRGNNIIIKVVHVLLNSWLRAGKDGGEGESSDILVFHVWDVMFYGKFRQTAFRHSPTDCMILLNSGIKITTGRKSRMRSRDRRSRLASSAPRHPDFFNLYHSPFHHPLDDPPASAFSLFQAILQFAILATYTDRHLSASRLRCFLHERSSERKM